MKKIFKVIIILLALLYFNMDVYASRQNPVIGELACPENNDGSCTENAVNGEVESVTVKQTFENGATVYKTVTKDKNVLGKYHFKLYGEGFSQTKAMADDVYVVFILDSSKIVADKYESIKNATTKFVNDLTKEKVKVAIVEFASEAAVVKKFNDKSYTFCKYTSKCKGVSSLDKSSHVEEGIRKAISLLDSISSKNKNVILLGDGQYWDKDDTNVNDAIKYFNSLNKIVPKKNRYMIQYDGREADYNESKNKCHFVKNENCDNCGFIAEIYQPGYWVGTYNKPSNPIHDKSFYKGANYDLIMSEIKNSIISINTSTVNGSFTITDRIGYEFDGGKESAILSSGDKSLEFSRTIKSSAPTGWHSTNDSFSVSYKNNEGKAITHIVSINPEVYWIQEQKELTACSSKSSFIINQIVRNGMYYYVECNENYGINLSINDLDVDTKKFELSKSQGIPINIDLNSDVSCSKTFKSDTYDEDHKALTAGLASASGRDKVMIQSEINEIEKDYNAYNKISVKNIIADYGNIFKEQDAKLNVVINNEYGKVIENRTVTLSNNKDVSIGISSSSGKFKKTLTLDDQKFDILTGENTSTVDQSMYLSGGNQYFPRANIPKDSTGYITLSLENLTIFGDQTINLEKDNCKISFEESEILYREISLNDPFISKAVSLGERKVGKNWEKVKASSSVVKFNFTKIIKNDVWDNSKSPLYTFKLGKSDISDITKNGSYSFNDCKIVNNRVSCDFVKKYSKN